MANSPIITPENLFAKWREGITSWGTKFYGEKGWVEQQMSPEEITKGVIYPYILTSLSPRLGTKVRFEQPVNWIKGRNKKMDAVLYDNEFKKALAHIEYENEYGHLIDEIPKFNHSDASLKVLITIPVINNKSDMAVFEEWISTILSPAIFNGLNENQDTKWLFIYAGDLLLREWYGIKFETKIGTPGSIKLT